MADETPLSVHEPSGPPKGGILVVQEAFGVNAHIEDVCGRFAADGWLAVAPHLYHRTGDPRLGYDELNTGRQHLASLTAEAILEDLDAGFARIDAAGIAPDATGVVGFCMGGSIALAAAAERAVGAAVTFYGGGVTKARFGLPPLVELAPLLEAPWLGLYGDRDRGIPVADIERLRAAAATAEVPTEVVRYPDAGHGFHCDQRSDFHAPSAADAWSRTLTWFGHHLTAAP